MTIRQLAPTILLFLLCGCGLLSRSHSRFFTLERIPSTAAMGSVSGAPLGLGAVELPPGMDRKEIVVRQSDGQLAVRETDQWASLLEPMVIHTLAFDLASRLPVGMVILPGQEVPLGPVRSIDVIFEELTAGPENRVVLDARWNVRGNEGAISAGTRHERIAIDIPSLESANVVSGVSRALASLADRISAEIVTRAATSPQ